VYVFDALGLRQGLFLAKKFPHMRKGMKIPGLGSSLAKPHNNDVAHFSPHVLVAQGLSFGYHYVHDY